MSLKRCVASSLVLLLAACGSSLNASTEHAGAYGANGVSVQLLQSDAQRYRAAAKYVASFKCTSHDDALHISERGHLVEGQFERGDALVYPPACCQGPTSIELDIWPADIQQCSTAHAGPFDLTSSDFDPKLRVSVACDELASRSSVEQDLLRRVTLAQVSARGICRTCRTTR